MTENMSTYEKALNMNIEELTADSEFLHELADELGLVHKDDLTGDSEVTASKSYGERLASTGSVNPGDYPVGDDRLEAQAERADPDAIRKTLGLGGQSREENLDDYTTGEL